LRRRSAGANASAVKEPGYFEVRKFSSQFTGCTFLLKKVDDLFSPQPQTQAANAAHCFTVKIFCSRKQSNRQGGARDPQGGGPSSQVINDLARPGVAPPPGAGCGNY